jgi:hypothetical protein
MEPEPPFSKSLISLKLPDDGQAGIPPNTGKHMMRTLSHTETSALQALLNWSADLLSRAAAAKKPRHRADQIAAAVAESGHPSGI